MIVNTSNLRVARRSYFLNYGGELERWLPPESIAAAGFKHLISTDIGAYLYKAVQRGMLISSIHRLLRVMEDTLLNAEFEAGLASHLGRIAEKCDSG